jgi:hypothetical protein
MPTKGDRSLGRLGVQSGLLDYQADLTLARIVTSE